MMQEFRCTVHNIKFAAEPIPNRVIGCPYCQQERMSIMRDKLDEATCHRDALLRAIEIKQTVEAL